MDKKALDAGTKANNNSRSEDPIPTIDISKNPGSQIPNNDPRSNRNKAAGGHDDEEESNILVAVRVRPMITREVNLGDFDIIRAEDKLIVRKYIIKNIVINNLL